MKTKGDFFGFRLFYKETEKKEAVLRKRRWLLKGLKGGWCKRKASGLDQSPKAEGSNQSTKCEVCIRSITPFFILWFLSLESRTEVYDLLENIPEFFLDDD